jgi:hypothetical protein
MQVISGIVQRQELARTRGIASSGIKIDHAIVGLAGSNPGVDLLAFGLALG